MCSNKTLLCKANTAEKLEQRFCAADVTPISDRSHTAAVWLADGKQTTQIGILLPLGSTDSCAAPFGAKAHSVHSLPLLFYWRRTCLSQHCCRGGRCCCSLLDRCLCCSSERCLRAVEPLRPAAKLPACECSQGACLLRRCQQPLLGCAMLLLKPLTCTARAAWWCSRWARSASAAPSAPRRTACDQW